MILDASCCLDEEDVGNERAGDVLTCRTCGRLYRYARCCPVCGPDKSHLAAAWVYTQGVLNASVDQREQRLIQGSLVREGDQGFRYRQWHER